MCLRDVLARLSLTLTLTLRAVCLRDVLTQVVLCRLLALGELDGELEVGEADVTVAVTVEDVEGLRVG